MTATIEATRPKLNIPEVTPRLNLPDDLPPELQINMQQVAESRRWQANVLDKQGFGITGRMRKVANEFIGIVYENGTTTFHNGDKKQTFIDKEPREDLNVELRDIMENRCRQYFNEDGNLIKGSEQAWENVTEIAPRVAGILLSKENNIKSVNRDQVKNVFAFAIEVAQDPSVLERTTISVGFGGSADAFTSSRLPAYGLPAQLIATKINQFYQERLNTAVDKIRVKKYQEQEVARFKETYFRDPNLFEEEDIFRDAYASLGEEAIADNEGRDYIPQLPFLSEEELAEIKTKHAIPDKPVKLRFFSGAEAGIVSNFPDQADEVRARREDNWQVIKDFTAENFPDLLKQMYFQNDTPWESHTPEQQVALEYFAHLLRTSNKDSIQYTVAVLQALGQVKGGQNGEELAAEYAGDHVNLFRDRMNLPKVFTEVFEPSAEHTKAEVNITIGGRSEEKFSGIRDYLVEHATPDGLRDFISEKAARLELEMIKSMQEHGEALAMNGHAAEYQAKIADIQKLRDMAKQLDDDIQKGVKYDDRPRLTMSLISGTEIAAYYAGAGDMPYGTNIEEQIAQINATKFEKAEDKIHAAAVKKDLVRLAKATKKAA